MSAKRNWKTVAKNLVISEITTTNNHEQNDPKKWCLTSNITLKGARGKDRRLYLQIHPDMFNCEEDVQFSLHSLNDALLNGVAVDILHDDDGCFIACNHDHDEHVFIPGPWWQLV